MVRKLKLVQKLMRHYEKKQLTAAEEKEENYYFRESFEPEEDEAEQEETKEYEILEREITPRKIRCPDCGGITLEGLEFCDKCGGELR